MNRIKGLVREPALLIDFVESLLVLLVAFGLALSGDQQTWIVALVVAIAGLAKGLATKPFPVTLVTDLGRAVLMLGISFGLSLDPERAALLITALGTLTTVVSRAQITPRVDPVTALSGAGSGPVRDESGEALLSYIGLVIVVISIIVLVLSLLDIVAVNLIAVVVVGLVGAVLWLAGGRVGPRGRP